MQKYPPKADEFADRHREGERDSKRKREMNEKGNRLLLLELSQLLDVLRIRHVGFIQFSWHYAGRKRERASGRKIAVAANNAYLILFADKSESARNLQRK